MSALHHVYVLVVCFMIYRIASIKRCYAQGCDSILLQPVSTQPHIALIPTNRMSISWVTMDAYPNNALPVLFFSDFKSNASHFMNDSRTQSIAGYTLSNVNASHFYHHTITPELLPSATYYYQPGCNYSAVVPFLSGNPTIPVTSNSNSNVSDSATTFLVYGDMGVLNSQNTIKLIAALINNTNNQTTKIDMIFHLGDISYADDYDLFIDDGHNPKYMSVFDEWAESMTAIFNHVPYMTSVGNHEQTCHSYADWHCFPDLQNFSTYRYYFRMPQQLQSHEPLLSAAVTKTNAAEVGGGPWNMWYSYNWRSIHFLIISTETDYEGCPDVPDKHRDIVNPLGGNFGDQMAFIEQDLMAAHLSPNISWIIAMGHRPWYTSARYGSKNMDWPPQTPLFMRKAFEPVFHKYNVDLYISGHLHLYERLYAIYDDNATDYNYNEPQSTVYIVSGAAGSIEGHGESVPALKNYTAKYIPHLYGITKFTVHNDTYLEMQFIESENQTVLDSMQLTKGTWT